MSFAIRTGTKMKTFFKNSTHEKFYQYTTETIFSKTFMDLLLADIMFKQSSFTAFSNAYNYLYSPSENERYHLNNKRLADGFFCFHLNSFFAEFYPDRNFESI